MKYLEKSVSLMWPCRPCRDLPYTVYTRTTSLTACTFH